MNRKLLWKTSVSLGLLGLLCAGSVFGIDTDTKEKLRRIAASTKNFTLAVNADSRTSPASQGAVSTGGQYIGATSSASALGCSPASIDATSGITVGCTFYEYQKNGSIGRQTVSDPVFHVINFSWMNQDNNSATGGRNVRYEAWDPSSGSLGDGTGGVDVGGDLIPPNRSGYVTMAGLSDGTVLNAHHWNPTFDVGIFRTYIFKNSTPALADFTQTQLPDSVWTAFDNGTPGSGDQFIWPQVAHTDFGATQITHLIIHNDNTNNTVGNNFLYTRRVGTTGTAWAAGRQFGWGGYLSPTVTASLQSTRVAIAFTGGRGSGTPTTVGDGFVCDVVDRSNGLLSGQTDNDTYVYLSEDGGLTWGPCTNITQRGDSLPGGFAPAARLTGLFDASDVYHVVWDAMQWNGYSGPFPFRSRLFHWDESSATIRTAVDAVWDPTDCNGGVFNLNVTQPQLSECDNKLYLTFVQYAPVPLGRGDDCAERAGSAPGGAANGDIYVTVSDNAGFNWDPPRNLTDSYTPDCDTIPGGLKPDCKSNAWPSAIRYGLDITSDIVTGIPDLSSNIGGYAGVNYLFMQYSDDADPGGAIQAEGGWTDNPIRAFRFGCVEKVAAAVLASSIPEGQAVDDPAFTLPGTDSTIAWRLENTGNTDLTYSISIQNDVPAGNVSVTGGTGLISSGAINFEDLTLTLNAGLETTEQHAHAEVVVTGNFVGGGSKTFIIDYTIGDVQQLEFTSIRGGSFGRSQTVDTALVIGNNGNIGRQNNGGVGRANMDLQGDPAETDTTGNADSYLFDGSPIVSYPGDGANIVVSSMFDFSFVDSFQFRPLEPTSTSEDANWYMANSGEYTTQDSTIGMRSEYWQPKAGAPAGWNVVYARVAFYSLDGNPHTGVTTAYGWDWDVPSDSGSRNTSGIDATRGFVYQQGSEFGADTGNTAITPNDQRFAAAGYYPGSKIDGVDDWTGGGSGAMNVLFKAQYTRDNATFVGGDWDHPALDSMLTNITGFNTYSTSAPDSLLGVDLHMVLNGGTYDIDANDTLFLHMMFLTGIASDNTTTDLEAAWDATYDAHPWQATTCCDTPGDFTNDGAYNIGDVTAGIAFIFSGGPGPACIQEADFNADGAYNIGDVTAGIAFIFTGGAAPACGP